MRITGPYGGTLDGFDMAVNWHYVQRTEHADRTADRVEVGRDLALITDGLFTRDFRLAPLIGVALPLHGTAPGKAIAASLGLERREELLGPGLLPAATRRTIVRPVLIRRHLERVAQERVAYSPRGVPIGHPFGRLGVQGSARHHAAIGCVGAWNNAAISRSSAQVAEAADSLQRALSFCERPTH